MPGPVGRAVDDDEFAAFEGAIDDGLGEVGIMEDVAPLGAWRLVGGEDDRPVLDVTAVDDLEEDVGVVVADTLYTMLAKKLRGFEDCNASKLNRHFVAGKAGVKVSGSTVEVTYPRRAHNPILRQVPWTHLPMHLPANPNAELVLRFQ